MGVLSDFEIVGDVLVKYRGDAKKVIIPSGVKTIGEEAFVTGIHLEEVIIPEGVECIERDAFLNCYTIKSISIPSTLTTIGAGAFWGCDGLADSEGFVIINDILFYNKYTQPFDRKSRTLIIPEGVKEISEHAFTNRCWRAEKIILPNSLKRIGANAFDNNDVEHIIIPPNVEYLGECAFLNFPMLKKVSLPKSLEFDKEKTFAYCDNLVEIELY